MTLCFHYWADFTECAASASLSEPLKKSSPPQSQTLSFDTLLLQERGPAHLTATHDPLRVAEVCLAYPERERHYLAQWPAKRLQNQPRKSLCLVACCPSLLVLLRASTNPDHPPSRLM